MGEERGKGWREKRERIKGGGGGSGGRGGLCWGVEELRGPGLSRV